MAQQQVVRAIYHAGRLQLLEPVDLPEGAELQITIPVVRARETPTSGPVYPTRPSIPDVLSQLCGLIAVGTVHGMILAPHSCDNGLLGAAAATAPAGARHLCRPWRMHRTH